MRCNWLEDSQENQEIKGENFLFGVFEIKLVNNIHPEEGWPFDIEILICGVDLWDKDP